jgi:hypothetical protein
MKKLLETLFNHERYQTIAIITAAVLLLVLWGCQGTAPSLLDPSKQVNRAELQNELDLMLIRAEQGFTKIEQRERIMALVLQQALIAGQTGTINPFALLTSIGTILGVGATVDNVRKRKEIKAIKKA